MVMESQHIQSLLSQHAELEAAIAEEAARPLPDSAMLSTLKRKKLKIKEEIELIKDKK